MNVKVKKSVVLLLLLLLLLLWRPWKKKAAQLLIPQPCHLLLPALSSSIVPLSSLQQQRRQP
jgi:hypothetical protein